MRCLFFGFSALAIIVCTIVPAPAADYNQNQRTLDDYLARTAAGATGDYATLLAELAGLSPQEYAVALNQISPEPYLAFSSQTLSLLHSYTQRVEDRQTEVRWLLGPAPKPEAESETSSIRKRFATTSGDWRTWAVFIDQSNSQDNTDESEAFESDGAIGILGVDRIFDRFCVGGNLGYSYGEMKADVHADGEMDIFHLGIYGGWFPGDFFVKGSIMYGWADYKMRRRVLNLPGYASRHIHADYPGDGYSLYLDAGYDWRRGPMVITPYLGLQSVGAEQYKQDETSSDEEGRGGANLEVLEINQHWLHGFLGLKFSAAIPLNRLTFIPQARVEYVHDFADEVPKVDARFAYANMPAAGFFEIRGADLPDSIFRAGVGLEMRIKNTVALTVDYDKWCQGERDQNTLAFGLEILF
ncbi:MAG: autotransporter outer membrane beta-barrel domain-containing protein [Planctomycetota bacterium]|nr:autotransporter outer membrane beta-barrel domain-containing protein [Planctomycetota bacterium]